MSDKHTASEFLLDIEQPRELELFLANQRWIAPDETIRYLSLPGEGNMNYTVRVHSNLRTFIVKQARPFVVKYPQIAAPEGRAEVEAAFYRLTQSNDKIRLYTPELMGEDPVNHLLMLQDLGQSSDFQFLYKPGRSLKEAELAELLSFITTLHNKFPGPAPEDLLHNREMRALNAEHIFVFPFQGGMGLNLDDITPGLEALAEKYRNDTHLKERIKVLAENYLKDGQVLLHGDFYPGSWLQTIEGIRVIDPEFCFYGPPEFDLGVLSAHLLLSDQSLDLQEFVLDTYQAPDQFEFSMMRKFAGVEVMRRLLGLAQLSLSASLDQKAAMLETAHGWLME